MTTIDRDAAYRSLNFSIRSMKQMLQDIDQMRALNAYERATGPDYPHLDKDEQIVTALELITDISAQMEDISDTLEHISAAANAMFDDLMAETRKRRAQQADQAA